MGVVKPNRGGTEPLDRTDSVVRLALQVEQKRKLCRAFLLSSKNLSFLAGSSIPDFW